MKARLEELRKRLAEVDDLNSAAYVLGWDQEVYMPVAGAEARGRQRATLRRLAHEKLTAPAVGQLLEELQPWAEELPYDSEEAALVRVARREYDREVRVPTAFAALLAEHQSRTYSVWAEARPQNDFSAVRPYLEKTLELSRQYSSFFPGYAHIADPLIDIEDPGVRVADLVPLFDRLREHLVPLAQAIADRPPIDSSCLSRGFPVDKQKAFCTRMLSEIGYDYRRGRQDISPHPFTTKFSITDVRFTVKIRPDDLGESVYGFLHEGGHALYEQGVDVAFEATPLASGTSAGVHESQSRLWENLVGRSREFWIGYYPRLQEAFPEQLGEVPMEVFHRAVNKVQPSLIRTEADEVTYNLHVMVRFGLELELLEGKLEVRDLPDAWRDRYQAYLGIVPPDDRDGVLQDVHWYSGTIGGMFHAYTLGNVLSAQFYDAALRAHPEIPSQIAQRRFEPLLGWLTEEIYRHGSKYSPAELVERVTGGPMDAEPYVRYLETKYSELYSL